MINKKNLIVIMSLMFFSAAVYCAEPKNFVTILNGASFAKGTSSIQTSSFSGQSLVFNEEDTRDMTVQSGFASVISQVQNSSITFTNLTENKEFETNVVPVIVQVKTTVGNITKIRYKIAQGTGTWESEQNYTNFESSTTSTVVFSESVSFDKCETDNYIQVYAQNSEDIAGSWSQAFTIKLRGGIEPGEVTVTSPDPLTALSSLNPLIETSEFDIKKGTVTVSLYEGKDTSGTLLYSHTVSSGTDVDPNSIFNSDTNKISYQNSKLMTDSKSLTSNKYYTLDIKFDNAYYYLSPFTFKAMGGGVADILTYPSPFNPNKEKIKIRYILAKDSNVTIKLYDKAGKIVKKLQQSSYQNAGTNEVEWDGRNYAGETLATGAYICEIIANSSDGESRRYTALAIVGR